MGEAGETSVRGSGRYKALRGDVRLRRLEIAVTGEQSPDPPWAYSHIFITACAAGARAGCSVGATQDTSATITYDYTIEDER